MMVRVRPVSILALILAFILGLLPGSMAIGQEWARKMFDSTEHKFGTVAKGAKAEHRFKIKNLYEEDVHISGVRSSCGCTTPTITKDLLKTFEVSELVAVYNTKTYRGDRSATLTVTFDKPFYAEVQVHISGSIRTDVVLQPGSVDLGSVQQGTAAERTVSIQYTGGRGDWQITDVRTTNSHINASLTETGRMGGQVSYTLSVRLAETAPAGYIKEVLTVHTNDSSAPSFPIEVEGRIDPEVSVSPASLFMGVLQPGQKVTKQLVVRAKNPFRIMSVVCENSAFSFDAGSEAKTLHLVPVTFVAPEMTGKVTQKVKIETDLGAAVVPEFFVYAQVVEKQ
jgi:hypothetical protein